MAPYFRPTTLDGALNILAETGATIAAGCTDLFPATDRPFLQGPVLDISGVSGLRGIATQGDAIRLGATTRWSDIVHADLPPAFDMLRQAAVEVGSVQIQNAGTLAGNLCNASPAADGVPCLLALDAQVELASVDGRRVMALADFITGPRQTARAPDELLSAVIIPATSARGQSAFLKLGARKYLVISIAMVAARLVTDADRITDAAIAVGACSAVARRLPELEKALVGQRAGPALPGLVSDRGIAAALAPIDDIRADAGYRATAAAELIRRALTGIVAPSSGVAA